MIFGHISLAFAYVTIILSASLLYLYLKNQQLGHFFHGGLFLLCGAVVLFAQYHLELGLTSGKAVFWSKFQYWGIFGYMYTFPIFVADIINKKLTYRLKLGLGILTLIFLGFTTFSKLIISNRAAYTLGLLQAEKGILYPFFVTILSLTILYFCTRVIGFSKRDFSKPINFNPLIVGIGISVFFGILDLVGLLLKRPVIPGIRNPFIIGIFSASVAFVWSSCSQYLWTIDTLSDSEKKITKLIEKSNKSFIEFVELIAKTLDAKDHYTAGHSLRVMEHAVKIARVLNLSESEIELLKQACLLHDIGKINIPDGILNKKSPLNEKERAHILRHPVVGKQILSTVSDFQGILDIIYTHHERIDGKGYPEGLAKNEIPLLSRIIAVADTYDAMRSERPYRRAKSKEQAIMELEKAKGSQLDEILVNKFIQIISA